MSEIITDEALEQERKKQKRIDRKRRKKVQEGESVEYENFDPFIADSKHITEIRVRNIPLNEIEKVEIVGEIKKIKKRKRTKRTMKKPKSRKKQIRTMKKTNGTILIITEKPQAAAKISAALGDAKKLSENKVPYYEIKKDGRNIIVACAVGHLFNLTLNEGKGYPVFDIKWEENSKIRKQDFSKKYLLALKKLVKRADEFIVATDYDIEGELIGYNIIRFVAKEKDAERMKFSTLTKDELENAFKNRMKTLDWGQAIAGETRHKLDWYYGINLSRALMSSLSKAGKFRIMSTGRVQGPTLSLIVKKEKQIQAFKPKDYWQIFIKVAGILLKHNKDITKKQELDKFKKLKGKQGEAKTEKKQQSISPPAPFDLTTLQTEAYKFYNIKPSQTLKIAQKLYLAGLISYPRTSSQKLPISLQYKEILKKLSKQFKETKLCKRKSPIEGNKSDPAHPAIHPTGNFSSLSGDDEKIYELIVKRFISCFCENAEVENKKIKFEIDKLIFNAKGVEIIEKAWMQVYPSYLKEKQLKDLDGEHKIQEVNTEKKQTQPPKRYSPASIISELAKRNLGTKATRASIIDTLYNRNYIKDTSIKATPLGISLIESMKKFSPIIIDEALTREFEKDMESIQKSKKDLEKKEEKIIQKAEKTIEKISKQMKKNEEKIGKQLIKATESLYKQQEEDSKLGIKCPKCKKGELLIKYTPKYKRYFVACSAYPKCKTTFSLPPGFIKQTYKKCESCNWPLLMRIQKGRRPWVFCFNQNCKTNQLKKENQSEKAST